MNLLAPFAGTLYLPDKEFLGAGSPVLLPDGRPVAGIRWHVWSERFEVLDPSGAVLAECRPRGVFRRRYPVRMPDGRPVVDLRPGSWRPVNGAEVTLAGGRRLRVRQLSMWSNRRFEFSAAEGPVGRITPTTGTFTFRPDSYAFELFVPVLSGLQAVSLAQALRMVVRAMRRRRSSSGSGGGGGNGG